MTAGVWERGAATLERLSHGGFDVAEFRGRSMRELRSLLSFDAAFFATVDPATLLFTSALAEEPLAAATSLFLDNEFGRDDVNKFAGLAVSGHVAETLDHATHGDRGLSARYREVLRPLGLGDELRVALVSGERCWGVLCLHRADAPLGFSTEEIGLLHRVAPTLAAGLRNGIALFPTAPDASVAAGPGIIVLGADLSVISVNPQAERWLSTLGEADWATKLALPLPIYAAAARIMGSAHDDSAAASATRLRRSDGGWISVQASPLRGPGGDQIAVILDAADAAQLSSLLLAAHGLTPAQTRVVALVLQGRSTRDIVDELHISSNTVQEHLKAVFDKFGIGSRRELVAALSGRPR